MGANSCPAVCCCGACACHAPTFCLRCTGSFVSVAWRSSSVGFLLVPLPPSSSWFKVSPSFPGFFFLVSGVCAFYFHWASGRSVTGAIVGGWAQVGMPVGVLSPWGVIAVAAPWPMGTQPPLATQALTGKQHWPVPSAQVYQEQWCWLQQQALLRFEHWLQLQDALFTGDNERNKNW